MKILFNIHSMSERFRLNWIDAGKGFITAALASLLFFIQTSLDAGTFVFDYKKLGFVFFSGGIGYLIKNYFSSPPK